MSYFNLTSTQKMGSQLKTILLTANGDVFIGVRKKTKGAPTWLDGNGPEAGKEREKVNPAAGFTLVRSSARFGVEHFTIGAEAEAPADGTEGEGRRRPRSRSDSCARQRSSISRREREGC